MNMQRLLDQLKEDEGFRSHVYQDHLGYWTIGYGRLVDERKNGGVSRAEASVLLLNDVNERVAFLRRSLWYYDNLPTQAQEALVQMAYQLGNTGLMTFRKMLAALEAGDMERVYNEAMDSKWAKKDTPARAKRVATQLAYGGNDD